MVKVAAAPSRAALRPPGVGAIRDQGTGPTFGIVVTGPSGPDPSIWRVRGPGRDDTIASRSHRLDTLPGGTGRRNGGATDTVRTRPRTSLPGRGRRGVVTLPLCPGRSSTTRLHRWSFRWFSFGRLILARASRSRLLREAIRDAGDHSTEMLPSRFGRARDALSVKLSGGRAHLDACLSS